MSVLLYVLGLSYGGVSDFLGAMGVWISKTTVYENVQAAGVASRQRQQAEVAAGVSSPVSGSDGTYLKVKGVQVGIQVIVADQTQDLLGLAVVSQENSPEMVEKLRELAAQVGAEVLVSADLDSYKEVASQLELDHQICRKHIKANVDAHVQELFHRLPTAEPVPPQVRSNPYLLSGDLALLQHLVWQRPPAQQARRYLRLLYHRYKAAQPAPQGHKQSIWYRMRTLVLRLWNRWDALTLDQRRDDLDGTNNTSERVIGWWIKERYRSMRGYQRELSILNVVTLTARMGARSGRYDLAELYT